MIRASDIPFAGSPQTRTFKILGEHWYGFDIQPDGIRFNAVKVHRDKASIQGELAVQVNGSFQKARTFGDGMLTIGEFNFSAMRSRSERAGILEKQSRNKELDWRGMLEEFCTEVILAERRGTPAIVLADEPADPEEAPEHFTVGGWMIPREFPMVLFGDSASGKSYFAMWAAGLLTEQGLRVLYADWELSKREHKKRLHRLFQPAPRLLYAHCDASLKHEAQRIQELLVEHKCEYLICDSIGFAVDGAAETHEAASAYFRALRQLKIGSLNIAHIPKQGDEGKEPQIFGCHSEDTDVLTDSGWKKHSEVTLRDTVRCFNPESSTFQWEHPTHIHQYHYSGEMIRIKTGTTDALVTPNHRCAIRRQIQRSKRKQGQYYRPEWEFVTADALPREALVPIAGPPTVDRPDLVIDGGDDFIRLVGWWIAEGSFHSKQNSFALAQAAASPLAGRIKATLERLNIPFTLTKSRNLRRPHEQEMWYFCSRQTPKTQRLTEWLNLECGSGAPLKRLPKMAWDLSVRQQQVLLEALLDGDGSRRSYGGALYHTVSRGLADDVQRLAIEIGLAAAQRWMPPGKVWHWPRGRVNIRRTGAYTVALYARHRSSVPYDGYVYCLSVPTGAYVTRYQGSLAIYGNSNFFRHGARSVWYIERAKENPKGEIRFGLYQRKNNLGETAKPLAYRLLFRGDRSIIEPIQVENVDELAAVLPLLDRMKRALQGGAMTAKALSEDLTAPIVSVRSVLNRHSSHFVKVGNKIGLRDASGSEPSEMDPTRPERELEF